jgi:hypothetical protein
MAVAPESVHELGLGARSLAWSPSLPVGSERSLPSGLGQSPNRSLRGGLGLVRGVWLQGVCGGRQGSGGSRRNTRESLARPRSAVAFLPRLGVRKRRIRSVPGEGGPILSRGLKGPGQRSRRAMGSCGRPPRGAAPTETGGFLSGEGRRRGLHRHLGHGCGERSIGRSSRRTSRVDRTPRNGALGLACARSAGGLPWTG